MVFISVSMSSFGNFSINSSSTITSIQTMTSASTITMDLPPPLPPRVKKRDSTLRGGVGDPPLSPHHQNAGAPDLPPRDTQAPPLPPRRDQTLPRNMSGMGGRPPSAPSPGTSSPRRNSEEPRRDRDSLPANINGERERSVTPELPPKTYRGAHSRKQSS